MHLTLQQETAAPPRSSNRAQQRAFDHFRKDYNHDRPHDALGGNVPADYYERSARTVPVPIWGKPFTYPAAFEAAKVSKLGYLQWNGRAAFMSTALAHETIGLDWRDQLGWDVYFAPCTWAHCAADSEDPFASSPHNLLPRSLQQTVTNVLDRSVSPVRRPG